MCGCGLVCRLGLPRPSQCQLAVSCSHGRWSPSLAAVGATCDYGNARTLGDKCNAGGVAE